MEQNIMANEEVVEAVAEEIVTTNSKFSWGKFALAGVVIGGVVVGATKLIKSLKAKKAKKESMEPIEEDWAEELEKTVSELSNENLDE